MVASAVINREISKVALSSARIPSTAKSKDRFLFCLATAFPKLHIRLLKGGGPLSGLQLLEIDFPVRGWRGATRSDSPATSATYDLPRPVCIRLPRPRRIPSL